VAEELETLAAVRYADIEFDPVHRDRWRRYWDALTGGRGADPDALDICVLKLRDAKWLRGDPESFCTALQQFLFER
jgi:hypothetical protein